MVSETQIEIERLREEVRHLASAVEEIRAQLARISPGSYRQEPGQTAPEHGPADLASAQELARRARERGVNGLIRYAGAYQTGERAYLWARDESNVGELLDQDDTLVAQVLAALGNKQRLLLLKALLERPASAAELVERLGLGTTGQVYHHLRTLQAADLVAQEERGQFTLKGHRVQGLVMLLAGVRDLLDDRYSAGTWEATSDPAS